MGIIKLRHSLQLNNYFTIAYKISFIGLLQRFVFIIYGQLLFSFIRN